MIIDDYANDLKKAIPGSALYANCWIYRHTRNHAISPRDISKPGKIKASGIILCTEGHMELTCNFQHYYIKRGDIFLFQPHNSLSVESINDSESYVVALADSNFSDYAIDMKLMPEILEKIYDRPILHLSENECSMLCNALNALIYYITNKEETPFKSSIIRSGMSIMAYMLGEMLLDRAPAMECTKKTSRENEHFNRFMKLLAENYLKEKEVTFYADRMSLTPRYLTTSVRKVSGYTVYEWICRFLMKDAKYLLEHTSLTIQQISYELNFSNQSFFGKFFKKHAGMSPGKYREKIMNKI